MKISKEVKVGFVALCAIALLVWGYNFLKGTNLLFKATTVYTEYPSIGGLVESSPVLINGFQVGTVSKIYFKPDQSGNIIVELTLTDSDIKIPNNSIANLISLDLLSSKAIGLSLGNSSIQLQEGDTIESFFEPSMLAGVTEQILPIKEKAENLMISMDTAIIGFNKTMGNLNDMFSERNKRNLSLAISNLKLTIESFDLLAKNFNSTLNTSIKPTMKKFGNVADTLKALELAQTLDNAQETLQKLTAVMDKINKGEGTMGQLVNNDSLYNNLTGASKQMEELLEDIKLHPNRYRRILSKKEIPYKKGN